MIAYTIHVNVQAINPKIEIPAEQATQQTLAFSIDSLEFLF